MENAAAETTNNAGGMPPPAPPELPKANVFERPIEPFRETLKARAHDTLDFSVTVPAGTPKEWLLSGDFWVHVVNRMILHCEIRVIWEDGSAYARLLCTHLQGRLSRFKCLEYQVLDLITQSDIGAEHGLAIKQKGTQKWCVIDTRTGDTLKKMIPTQGEALRELNDMIAARVR